MNPFKWVKKKEQQVNMAVSIGILRHAITTVGAVLVTNGYMTNDQLKDAVGALMVSISVIWSTFVKWDKERKTIHSESESSKP